jgi:hypothetical protein
MKKWEGLLIIEKKTIWFHLQAKKPLEMHLQNDYLNIAIWMTSLKKNITRF